MGAGHAHQQPLQAPRATTGSNDSQATEKDDLVTAIRPIGAPDISTVQPAAAFGALGFEPKEIVKDASSKVQLSLRCEELARAAPTFVVVYSKCLGDEHWRELGMSEVSAANTKSPVFDPSFAVDFRAEVRCRLRFEVYRVRDHYCVEELLCQKFLGAAEAVLVDALMARSQGNGWLTKDLLHPKPSVDSLPGRIAIWAEEETASKYMVSFNMVAKGLRSTDFWKNRADPYVMVHRTLSIPNAAPESDIYDEEDHGLKCTPVYHSEVQRRTNGPRFRRVELTSSQLCQNKPDQEIVVEIYDWFRVQRHRYMGEGIVTFSELQKAWRTSKPLEVPICYREGSRLEGGSASRRGSKETGRSKSSSKDREREKHSSKLSKGSNRSRTSTKDTRGTVDSETSKTSNSTTASKVRICGRIVGTLRFEEVGVERRYSFLDYVRGGLELRLMVAVDFTRSNVGPHHPDSFHYMDAGRQSAYATAIRAVGDVMRSYSNTEQFTAFGFGAKIPPSHSIASNAFSLTGDFFDPVLPKVEGVIKAYQRALQVVQLHGPTRLAQVIELAGSFAKPYAEATAKNAREVPMNYQILLILTDGAIDDQMDTINEVAKAWDLPLSIVVIGIGDEDFTFLEDLTAEVGAYRRMQEEARGPAPIKPPEPVSPASASGLIQGEKKEQPLRGPPRNMVHFVRYNDFRDRPGDLAAAALEALPREVCGYYTSRSVKPRGLDTMEDESGNPVPKVIPNMIGGRKQIPSKQAPNLSRTSVHTAASRNSSLQSSAKSEGQSSTKEAARMKLEQQPEFVQAERSRLTKEAQSLGYDPNLIKRAFRNGIACNTLECLVDNIVHAGYGKLPSYKEAMETAIPDMEATLPGQPFIKNSSMPVTTVARASVAAPERAPMNWTMSEGGYGTGYAKSGRSTLISKAGHPALDGAPAMGSVGLGSMGLGSKGLGADLRGRDGTGSKGSTGSASLGSKALGSDLRGAAAASRALSNGSYHSSTAESDNARASKDASGREIVPVDKQGAPPKRPSVAFSSQSSSGGSVHAEPQPRVRQLSQQSIQAIENPEKLTRRSSARSILIQPKEGDAKRFSKVTRASFAPDQAEHHEPPEAPEANSLNSSLAASSMSLRDAAQTDSDDGPRAPLDAPGGEELGVCGICLEEPVNTELLPCKHRVACHTCAAKLGVVCPLCQATVNEVRRLR